MERELLSTRWDVSRTQLARVLDKAGFKLKDDLGPVRHASLCLSSKNGAVHFVLNGSKGPVIVLPMPKEFVSKRVTIKSKKLEGMILPTCNGSIAVVGPHGEQLLQIAQKMAKQYLGARSRTAHSPQNGLALRHRAFQAISFRPMRPHTYIQFGIGCFYHE
jgi:hypothetical protein